MEEWNEGGMGRRRRDDGAECLGESLGEGGGMGWMEEGGGMGGMEEGGGMGGT